MSIKDRTESEQEDFFQHEIVPEPPALSKNGQLYHGTKSAMMDCLPKIPQPGKNPLRCRATMVALDMAGVVHMIKPGTKTKNFKDYAHLNLIPFLKTQLSSIVVRLDSIWESYGLGVQSLKNETRLHRRGTATRRIKVGPTIPVPKGKGWQEFLRDSENKKQLFEYLSEELQETLKCEPYQVYSTKKDLVLSAKQGCNISPLEPCSQEEADTRIMLHLFHAAEQGHKVAFVRTVDTDVVVIATYFFPKLKLEELWVGLGSGKHYKDVPVHEVSNCLGPEKCSALLLFYAMTGTDQTSAFKNIGKKKAWIAWDHLGDELTQVFITLTDDPTKLSIDSDQMNMIQRFTVAQYDLKSDMSSVNQARRFMFTKKLKPLESIPPTKHALYQHAKRSVITANYWSQSLKKQPNLLPPADYGWVWNERLKLWVPHWSDLPDVSRGCALLISCGCRVACKANCKCSKNIMRCTPLCACQGMCINNEG